MRRNEKSCSYRRSVFTGVYFLFNIIFLPVRFSDAIVLHIILCDGRSYCIASNEIIWRKAPRSRHICRCTDWNALTNSQLSKSGFESNSVTGLYVLFSVPRRLKNCVIFKRLNRSRNDKLFILACELLIIKLASSIRLITVRL